MKVTENATRIKRAQAGETLDSSVEKLKALLEEARRRKFTFLLIGRTGVGKTSTVNTLMGQEVAKTGKFRPTTMSVKSFRSEIEGVRYVLFDTPGLCDELPSKGKDKEYIEKIRSKVSEIDCLWFVTRLDENRLRPDEMHAISIISKAFGKRVWDRSIIVFTFADKVEPSEYKEYFTERTNIVREEIAKFVDEKVANKIPSVVVSNHSDKTPDGISWLGELFTVVYDRISEKNALPFLVALASRVKTRGLTNSSTKGNEPEIMLDDSQISRVKERTETVIKAEISADIIPSLAALGAGIGLAAGPAGAAIGGATGAVVGLIAWLYKKK